MSLESYHKVWPIYQAVILKIGSLWRPYVMIFAFLARGFMTGAIKKCSFAKTYFFCLVFVLVYLLFHPYPQTIHVHYVNYHQCMSKDKRTILMSIFIFNSLLFCILLCTSYLLSALSPLSACSAKNCCLICF